MVIRRVDRDRPLRIAALGRGGGRVGLVLAVLVALGGCSIDRALRPGSYTVQRGDTLSGIARSYDIDWRQLAQWNHIAPPYRLRVGEQLTLKPYPPLNYARMSNGQPAPTRQSSELPPQRAPQNDNSHTQPLAQSSAPQVIDNSASSTAQTPASTQQASGATPDTSTTQSASSTPAAATSSGAAGSASSKEENSIDHASASATTRQTTVKAGGPSADGWQWPATGSLLRGYDASARRRGIEIGGKEDSPIYAASSGTVVYNGSGLKGYGKLIIIKHDAHYLSAYGFIDKSRVKQGQTIAAGAQIADMGLGPGNKPMLHFEIRKDGDPVDPEKLLPSR